MITIYLLDLYWAHFSINSNSSNSITWWTNTIFWIKTLVVDSFKIIGCILNTLLKCCLFELCSIYIFWNWTQTFKLMLKFVSSAWNCIKGITYCFFDIGGYYLLTRSLIMKLDSNICIWTCLSHLKLWFNSINCITWFPFFQRKIRDLLLAT